MSSKIWDQITCSRWDLNWTMLVSIQRCGPHTCKDSIYIVMVLSGLPIDHYTDVIMSMMASQITGVSIGYSIVCSDADQRKYQISALLAFVRGIHVTGEFPAERASNEENVSIWWRYHDSWTCHVPPLVGDIIRTSDYRYHYSHTLHEARQQLMLSI